MNSWIKWTAICFSIITFTLSAHAYDDDTHFYGTYAMARFSGIGHEVASKLALGAQWMDEAYISNPLNVVGLDGTGLRKRRLLHFPGTGKNNELSGHGHGELSTGIVSRVAGSILGLRKAVTITEKNHAFASEMFTEGLFEGNLMKTAGSLHTIQDSFAHAGTTSQAGHAYSGHWNDRPYATEGDIQKYREMVAVVFRAMVAIRSLLPAAAIDGDASYGNLNGSFGKANAEMSAAELAKKYLNLPLVKNTVEHYVLTDPEYVAFALNFIIKRAAEKSNYLVEGSNLMPFVEQVGKESGITVKQAMTQIVANISSQGGIKEVSKYLHIQNILTDAGFPGSIRNRAYVASMGGIAALTEKVIDALIEGVVPRAYSPTHKFELEEENDVRKFEMKIRNRNMRHVITTLFGIDVELVHNQTPDLKGFLLEVKAAPEAEPKLPTSNETVYLSYKAKEKQEWNNMIFHFVYPAFRGTDLETQVRNWKIGAGTSGVGVALGVGGS